MYWWNGNSRAWISNKIGPVFCVPGWCAFITDPLNLVSLFPVRTVAPAGCFPPSLLATMVSTGVSLYWANGGFLFLSADQVYFAVMIAQVVRADVMRDASGRSKGCGIVEYRTAMEAQTAINTLLDTELKGRLIFVREDREAAGASVRVPVCLAYRSTGFCSFFLASLGSAILSRFLLPATFPQGMPPHSPRMYLN